MSRLGKTWGKKAKTEENKSDQTGDSRNKMSFQTPVFAIGGPPRDCNPSRGENKTQHGKCVGEESLRAKVKGGGRAKNYKKEFQVPNLSKPPRHEGEGKG